MYLDSIRQTIAAIKSNLTGEPNVKKEALIAALEANAKLTRIIEQILRSQVYSRYLLRDTKICLSLAEKLTKSEPGSYVHLTAAELKEAEKIIKV